MQPKILIVDDSPETAALMQFILQPQGYEVIIAADGKSGLEQARNLSPDLIILDLMLPYLNGYKICRMLKFDQRYKKIPILVLTARAEANDRLIGYEVGADFFINKPVVADILIGKVRELLTNKGAGNSA